MKYIGIETPCSQNFHSMLPNAQGSYCNQCAQNVIDFSVKSDSEIIEILQLNDKQCGRFSVTQLERMNKDLDAYSFQSKESFRSALVFSLFVVFGLSLFSCNDVKQKKEIEKFQKELKKTYLSEKPVIPEAKNQPVQLIEIPEVLPMVYESIEVVEWELPPDTIAIDEVIVKGQFDDRDSERYVLGGPMLYYDYVDETTKEIKYDRDGMIIPNEFSSMAFPNPTQDNTTLEIKAPTKEKFEIGLYDMNGKLMREIYSGKIDRGTFQQEIEMSDLPSGMYLIMIVSKDYKETVRVSKI